MRAFIAALMFSVLVVLSVSPAVLAAPACNGCSVDGRCLPVGYRITINSVPSFCGIDGIEAQKQPSALCQDNFECLPNMCSSGRCVEARAMQDMFTSIYCRLFNLFNEQGYQNCLVDHGAGVARCGDGACNGGEDLSSCPSDCVDITETMTITVYDDKAVIDVAGFSIDAVGYAFDAVDPFTNEVQSFTVSSVSNGIATVEPALGSGSVMHATFSKLIPRPKPPIVGDSGYVLVGFLEECKMMRLYFSGVLVNPRTGDYNLEGELLSDERFVDEMCSKSGPYPSDYDFRKWKTCEGRGIVLFDEHKYDKLPPLPWPIVTMKDIIKINYEECKDYAPQCVVRENLATRWHIAICEPCREDEKWNSEYHICENACGDGTIDTGEQCDDGNTADGDGCSSACQTEGSCGDGSCNGDETCYECPNDCGSCPPEYCGDSICGPGEDCNICAADCGECPPEVCGDAVCGPDETCDNCPADCGSCPTCGNGVCDSGETCSSCPADCGPCCTQVCNASTCGQSICGTQCPPCVCENTVTAAFINFLASFRLAEECPTDPCEGVVCDDGNPCTDDSCSGGVCNYVDNGNCGDPCYNNPDPCCGSSDPCCGSSDPSCGGSCPPESEKPSCPDGGEAVPVQNTGVAYVFSGAWDRIVNFFAGVASVPCDMHWECKTPQCTDSDGGQDRYTQGTTTKGSQSETDYCMSSDRVNEFYCSSESGNIASASLICFDGFCLNGACITSSCGDGKCDPNEDSTCPDCADPCPSMTMSECLMATGIVKCAWDSETNTCYRIGNA